MLCSDAKQSRRFSTYQRYHTHKSRKYWTKHTNSGNTTDYAAKGLARLSHWMRSFSLVLKASMHVSKDCHLVGSDIRMTCVQSESDMQSFGLRATLLYGKGLFPLSGVPNFGDHFLENGGVYSTRFLFLRSLEGVLHGCVLSFSVTKL